MHWWFVWAVALLSLRSPSALGASNFHLRNHTGALFLYAFDNGQVPTSPPSFVPDRLGLNLMGNLTTSTTDAVTWSQMQQGMTVVGAAGGSRAQSQLTSESVLTRLTTEFSIELFLTIRNNPASQNLMIAGFGDWVAGAPFSPCNETVAGTDGGWRLYSSFGSGINFEGVLLENGVPRCFALSISIPINTVRHLVMRSQLGVLSIVSSHSVPNTGPSGSFVDDSIRFDPEVWARKPAPLSFATPHPSAGWAGIIHMAAMYDRFLSNAEIFSLRTNGPPNSLPTCVTTALTVLEDGTSTLFP